VDAGPDFEFEHASPIAATHRIDNINGNSVEKMDRWFVFIIAFLWL
jgi:hypothetical protein